MVNFVVKVVRDFYAKFLYWKAEVPCGAFCYMPDPPISTDSSVLRTRPTLEKKIVGRG
jgi:hypothetical protein